MQRRVLSVEMENGQKKVEIAGTPVDIMCMATDLLSACLEGLEKCPQMSHEDAVKLMDEVVDGYKVEAHFGKEAAKERALLQFLKHC